MDDDEKKKAVAFAVKFLDDFDVSADIRGNTESYFLQSPTTTSNFWANHVEGTYFKSYDDLKPHEYDIQCRYVADKLRRGSLLKAEERAFVADVLEGKRKRPITKGQDKYSSWDRDYTLWRCTLEVETSYRLPRYSTAAVQTQDEQNNTDEPNPVTAVEIVSMATKNSKLMKCSVDVVIKACKNFKNETNFALGDK